MIYDCRARGVVVLLRNYRFGLQENGFNVTIAYTIGYEGAEIDHFIATLKIAGVKVLADVRAVAHSRKKGFSKTALRKRLEEEGITYSHFVELGDPKLGREAARAGRYDEFRKIYARHLSKSEPQHSLHRLGETVLTASTCLLCFERDPKSCHRSIVANRLKGYGVKSVHLFVSTPLRHAKPTTNRTGRYSGQGASATQ